MSVQLMMEMALASSMLTGEELIEQFAIEKGSDVVRESQMRELSNRISLYIKTLQRIHTDPDTNTTMALMALIERMSDHLKVVTNLSQLMAR